MTTKRFLITTTVLAAITAAPAGAAADAGSHRAVKLRATLTAVRADVADYGGFSGKADLLVNGRNAKSSLHLRGMVPGATYTWAIVSGADATTVCASGTPVTGLKYKRLHANRGGRANSTASAKKRAFTYDATKAYAVVVYQAGKPGEALLCGVLQGKAKKKHATTGHGKSGSTGSSTTGSDHANSHAGDHPSGHGH